MPKGDSLEMWLGYIVLFGGVIFGAVVGYENPTLLAFFYAAAGAVGVFLIQRDKYREFGSGRRLAVKWAASSFVVGLPLMLLVIWGAVILLP